MAREKSDWNSLIRSIRGNRAGSATYYKPVCVIAAIDLADIGRLDSELLHSELIIRRFGEYVTVAFPDRATAGWLPLWFLANDGLWTFSKRGKRLPRDVLKMRPSTKNKAFEKFDTQSIAEEYRALWHSQEQRKILRDQMLLILSRDSESRTLLRALLDIRNVNEPALWPTDEELDAHLRDLTGQGDLFLHNQSEAQSEQLNIDPGSRKKLLEFKVETLPATTAVGPIFEANGETPIRLAPNPQTGPSAANADLHSALAVKCMGLQSLAGASNNRAAHILPALAALGAALQAPISQSSSYLIWSHGNTLRQLYDAELKAVASNDPESPPLPDRLQVLLADLVEQFNVYAIADHVVALLDRAKAGPERRAQSLQVLDAGVGLVTAIRESPGLLEPDAVQVLEATTTAAQEASHSSGFNADQAVVNAVEIQRNGALAILKNAVLEVRKAATASKSFGKQMLDGAAKQLGSELVKQLPLALFVATTREFFIALWKDAVGSQRIQQLVQLIRDFIDGFRH
jgi:hypothetical protein